jgi:flagellar biosynthesis GTPase FlhF
MTEEVKQEEQATPEKTEAPTTEKTAPVADQKSEPKDNKKEETPQTPTETKNKKINRLSLDEINAKIEEYQTKNMTKAKYYHHLLERKREIESPKETVPSE